MIATYRSATIYRNPRTALGLCIILGAALLTSGCATSKDEMWAGEGVPMQELWRQGAGNGEDMTQRGLLDARGELRRQIGDGVMVDERIAYTRNAANEIYSQFTRLDNPDLVMYVFPHLAGADPVPIPGYSTVFSLYSRPQYAMPGETARPQAPEAPDERRGRVSVELVGGRP
ncbi:TIGR03751 family conjugal transfer lipoprotein [Billgrantia montanilacus]|uniref:TIGR03751 family conjugal transfer lipoprotein n=1 Tax=Billgrantia montanilacus TaxID=2282305 RepID=A0A368TQI9_9GAMM|nr:TIGR03751 family conjugal transfer lipoprotein [Halomonas montanilacus]RCV86914.1 TIGR03751 family conjugal transfer lipoprotein [Halomonas montanilacus]